jgi:hypothetical protein
MAARAAAAGLAAGLVAGVLGGWLAFSGTPPALPPVAPPGAAPDGGSTARDPVAAPPPAASVAPASPAPAPAPSEPAPASASSLAAARALLATLPPDDAARGSGSVRVIVESAEGVPVEGVRVSLDPVVPRSGLRWRPRYHPGEDPSPEEQVVETVAAAARTRATRREAMTGADGRGTVQGVGDADHRVTALARGWNIHASGTVRAGEELRLVARPLCEVEVTLVLPGGGSPAEGQIVASGDGGTRSTSHGWSAGWPLIRLEPGRWTLRATTKEGYASEPTTVDWTHGVAIAPLRFDLRARPGLRGRISFPDDEAPERASVRVLPARGAPPRPDDWQRSSNQASAGTHQGWRYSFPDLAPGRWWVAVFRGHGEEIPAAMLEVEVADGPRDLDIAVPPPDPETVARLRVRDATGRPVTELQVTLQVRSEGSNSSYGMNPSRLRDGTFVVSLARREKGAANTLLVSAPGQGQRTLEIPETGPVAMDIQFEEPATGEIRLANYLGTYLDGRVEVRLEPAEDSGFRGSRLQVGPKGEATLAGAQPGPCVVVVSTGSRRTEILRAPVVLRAGRNELTVTLPETHRLEVRGGAGSVSLRRADGTGRTAFLHATVDAEGIAVVDGLVPGEYEVRSGARKPATVRVPGTATVTLE